MTTITIDVPEKQEAEYKEILSNFVREYSIEKLQKISENSFYEKMLNGVFQDENTFKELSRKDGKLDFSELLI